MPSPLKSLPVVNGQHARCIFDRQDLLLAIDLVLAAWCRPDKSNVLETKLATAPKIGRESGRIRMKVTLCPPFREEKDQRQPDSWNSNSLPPMRTSVADRDGRRVVGLPVRRESTINVYG